jgi:RNA polymerase sigma-70 factor (ECF subfamily)
MALDAAASGQGIDSPRRKYMSNPRNSMNSPEPVGPSLPRDAAAEQKNTAPDPAPSPPETLPAPCEADLLAKVLAGDHLSFARLYSLHKKRVYSLCMRMVGNAAEAEDLTQETFLQLHRKISTFRGDSAFSTWLHRLAINVVLMHLRKKGLSMISMDEAMDPAPEKTSRGFGARDLRLSGSVDRLALERAVSNLPAGYRLAFVLHDVEGYDHQEIASMLDCSTGNIKSQLHKARLKLRDALRVLPRQEERR